MDTSKFTDVVGKRIVGVVLKESADGRPPRSQVFFEFADGTYFELYSDSSIYPVHAKPTRTPRQEIRQR